MADFPIVSTSTVVGTVDVTDNFVFDSATPTLFMCGLYMVLGVTAIGANILNIAIFLTNDELRRKYIFYIALDAGEMINGLSYVLTSIGRGSGVLDGTFGVPITYHDCFFNRYWVHTLIMGTELPALITVVISIERILAVHKPKLYSAIVTHRTKVASLVGVVVLQLCSLTIAGISAYENMEKSNTRHCAIITSTATFFSTFHFTFIACAYVVSFVSLLVIYIIHRQIKKNAQNSYGRRRNPQLGLFLSVTGSSIILVAMPSIVMIGIRWHWFTVNDIGVGLTYATTGFLSVTNTILNFIFREEYRIQLKQFIRFNLKSAGGSRVFVTSRISPLTEIGRLREGVTSHRESR
ncbi:hypothetical protein QR680_013897 [Steinernema hermaphroditum]|uniref:G-protein coupled receptors family 1 profile domain-containing protein n=1 Tax=Steinernema hermaphroditum TaxID=289476 RepID=A0AA39I723_9BILA|nr:hypothetical protein QR680_013897 [Steinernema hermaphroditum]